MPRQFYTEGTGNQQILHGAQDEKLPVYATLADAEADLANLEEGQIIATKDVGSEMSIPVNEVRSGEMHAVTSNAVSKSLSYSTEEKKTGGYWADSKPIYQKTYTGLTIEASVTTIDTLTNVSKFIRAEFLITIYTDTNRTTVSSYDTSASTGNGYVRLLPNGQLRGYSGSGTNRITDVTIWYTKTTD